MGAVVVSRAGRGCGRQGGGRLDRGDAPGAGHLVKDHGDAALEGASLTMEPGAEGGEGDRGEPQSVGVESEKAQDEEEGGEGAPDDQVGGERPARAKPAPKDLGPIAGGFGDGDEGEAGPAGSEDLDVEVGPTGVGAAGPAMVLDGGDDALDPVLTVAPRGGPVGAFADGGLGIDAGLGFQGIDGDGGGGRRGAEAEAGGVTGGAPDHRLDVVEESEQRASPPGRGRRGTGQRGAEGGEKGDGDGEGHGGEGERPQPGEVEREQDQRQGDGDVILEAGEQGDEWIAGGGVERLEKPGGEKTPEDGVPTPGKIGLGGRADSPAPAGGPEGIEAGGMLGEEEGFGGAVAGLLAEISADGGAAVVPDESGRREPEAPAAALEPPADIDVVARLTEDGIEAADRLESPLPEGHVAARDVLGEAVVEEDMHGTSRGRHDQGGDRWIVGREEVGSADAGDRRVEQSGDQEAQPVGVHTAVRIREGDDLARGRTDAEVAGIGKALVGGEAEGAELGVLSGDPGGVVRRAVVHDHDLVVGVTKADEGVKAVPQGRGGVVGGDDDGDAGGSGGLGRGIGEAGTDGGEGGFAFAGGGGDAHRPIGDGLPIAVPVVGEGEDHRACQASGDRGGEGPGEDFGLAGRAFPECVHAAFTEQQRFAVGKGLKVGEVVDEGGPAVEEDVEGDEVEVAQVQELGGGIIGVREEAVGRGVVGGDQDFVEEGGNPAGAVPADDVGRDLVAHGDGEDRGVMGDGLDGGENGGAGGAALGAGAEKSGVRGPGGGDQEAQSAFGRGIQKPGRWNVVEAHRVGTQFDDGVEVGLGPCGSGERFPRGVGREGAVGDAPDEPPFGAGPEELAVEADPVVHASSATTCSAVRRAQRSASRMWSRSGWGTLE